MRECVHACGGRASACVRQDSCRCGRTQSVCAWASPKALSRHPTPLPLMQTPCPALGTSGSAPRTRLARCVCGGGGGACARTYTPPPPSPPSPCTLPSPTQPPTHPTKADVGRHQEAHLRQLAQCPELVRQRQEHCTGGECVCGVRVWEWIGGLKQGPLPPAQGVSACAWWWGGGGAWAPQARHLHLHARPQMRCHPPLLSPRAGG